MPKQLHQVEITEKAERILTRIMKAFDVNTTTVISMVLEDQAYTSFARMESKLADFIKKQANREFM